VSKSMRLINSSLTRKQGFTLWSEMVDLKNTLKGDDIYGYQHKAGNGVL